MPEWRGYRTEWVITHWLHEDDLNSWDLAFNDEARMWQYIHNVCREDEPIKPIHMLVTEHLMAL